MRSAAFILLTLLSLARADDFSALCDDRAAVERVYYQHRLGDKPPFEQTLPRSTLERLVRNDLRKEAALKKAYGVEVTPAMLAAEIQRINATTRAPDILAELKAALGHDTNRFARTIAKPVVVERLLRDKFENDDALHLPRRREAERVREQLLATRGIRREEAPSEFRKGQSLSSSAATNALLTALLAILKSGHSNEVTETTWLLPRRPAETNSPADDEIEIKQRFGPQAQLLSARNTGKPEHSFHFEDLPPALQNVLRVQLRQSGDVSAVIELPTGFAVYLLKAKTANAMNVATLSLPKRSYEQWLAEQPENP